MKAIYIFVAALMGFAAIAQQPAISGGEYIMSNQHSPCLTDQQRQQIQLEVQESADELIRKKLLPSTSDQRRSPLLHPQFIWPVIAAPGSIYNNSWSISNHVDHNAAYPNQVQDYNCGPRTYDTSGGYNHMGIDIFTWPFSWYQMENSQSHAVAAAAGVIIYKSDGNFDKNCSFNSSNWNAVYLQHADGSRSWYGHLKNGSLTTKALGATVVAGEYLGVIGSSGNSTGPHLHFEVYNSFNQLVDPYVGTCNTWTSSTDSWWAAQKPYVDIKINAVLTHSAPPIFNTCPTTEIVNLSNDFAAGSSVVGAIYLADQTSGTSGLIQLLRPDGTVKTTYPVNFTVNYSASYWYWTLDSSWFDQTGTWTFVFSYNGDTVNHTFSYGSLGIEDQLTDVLSVYPNPTDGIINLQAAAVTDIYSVSVYDLSGKIVHSKKEGGQTVDISGLASGIYMLRAETSEGPLVRKIIKK